MSQDFTAETLRTELREKIGSFTSLVGFKVVEGFMPVKNGFFSYAHKGLHYPQLLEKNQNLKETLRSLVSLRRSFAN